MPSLFWALKTERVIRKLLPKQCNLVQATCCLCYVTYLDEQCCCSQSSMSTFRLHFPECCLLFYLSSVPDTVNPSERNLAVQPCIKHLIADCTSNGMVLLLRKRYPLHESSIPFTDERKCCLNMPFLPEFFP